jgi:hypothetical protein
MRPALLPCAVLVALPALAGADEGGLFPAGEAFSPAESESPRQVSRASVRTVAASGGRAAVDVPLTGRGRAILWTLTASPGAAAKAPEAAPTSLRTPGGRVLRPGEERSADRGLRRFALRPAEIGLDVPGTQEAVEVGAAEAGLHRVEVEAADGSAVTVVAAEPDSPLALATWASPLSRLPGQPVTLHAELRDGGRPVKAARVSVRLAAPGRSGEKGVSLLDDGRRGDAVAGDGVYSRRFDSLPAGDAGFWTARFEAEGRDARGAAFARSGTSGFVVERATARLLGSTVRARREGAGLVVEAAAQVSTAGLYRLDAVVAGARAEGGRPALAWAEAPRRLSVGTARLAVRVPLPEDGRVAEIVEVRLLGLEPMGVAGRTLVPVE